MNMTTHMTKNILGITIAWTMIVTLNAMALGNTDNEWRWSIQHARQFHVDKRVMTDAKPIGEAFGRKCLEALRRYYGDVHIPSDLVVLKHSSVMELPGFQDMQIAIIEVFPHPVRGEGSQRYSHITATFDG